MGEKKKTPPKRTPFIEGMLPRGREMREGGGKKNLARRKGGKERVDSFPEKKGGN